MKKRVIGTIMAGVLVFGAFLTGCGRKEQADSSLNQATELNVGVSNYTFPAIIAQEKGFFEEEFGDTISYNLSMVSGGPAMAEAISGGSLDLGYAAGLPIIQNNANDGNIKIFAQYQSNSEAWSHLYVRADLGISTVAELKGHLISYSVGTINHQALLLILEGAGLTADDVQLVSLDGSGSAKPALLAGSIDACLSNNIIDDPSVVEIADTDGYLEQINYLFGSSKYAEANPDIIERYLKVLQKSAEWVNENPDEAVALVAAFQNKEEEDVWTLYNASAFEVTWSSLNEDNLNKTIDFSYEVGNIDTKTDLSQLVDDTYVKAAGYAK